MFNLESFQDIQSSAYDYLHNVPHFTILAVFLGFPSFVEIALSSVTTSGPLTTSPNTTCLLSSHGHGTKVMKNWDPFVSFPALAIDNR